MKKVLRSVQTGLGQMTTESRVSLCSSMSPLLVLPDIAGSIAERVPPNSSFIGMAPSETVSIRRKHHHQQQ